MHFKDGLPEAIVQTCSVINVVLLVMCCMGILAFIVIS